MFLHIHNHAIMRCVQVHLTKKVKCVFSFCFTSNSRVKSNISKNTSKKHEEDAAEVKNKKRTRKKVMTHFCVLFFCWKLLFRKQGKRENVIPSEKDNFLNHLNVNK